MKGIMMIRHELKAKNERSYDDKFTQKSTLTLETKIQIAAKNILNGNLQFYIYVLYIFIVHYTSIVERVVTDCTMPTLCEHLTFDF